MNQHISIFVLLLITIISFSSYTQKRTAAQSMGIAAIVNDEIISKVLPLPIEENSWEKYNIFFCTSFGMVRKNKLIDVAKSGQQSLRGSGKTAIKLLKNDTLISVNLCNDSHDSLLSTTDGKCIRFHLSKIRLTSGLNSKGVRGIKLKEKKAEILRRKME